MVPPAPSADELVYFLLEFDDEDGTGDELEDTISDQGRVPGADDLDVMRCGDSRNGDDQGPPTIPSPCPWLDVAAG